PRILKLRLWMTEQRIEILGPVSSTTITTFRTPWYLKSRLRAAVSKLSTAELRVLSYPLLPNQARTGFTETLARDLSLADFSRRQDLPCNVSLRAVPPPPLLLPTLISCLE